MNNDRNKRRKRKVFTGRCFQYTEQDRESIKDPLKTELEKTSAAEEAEEEQTTQGGYDGKRLAFY
jgi:hypothetical protein